MFKFFLLILSLVSTSAFADLQLAATSPQGVSSNYWVIIESSVDTKHFPGEANPKIQYNVKLGLFQNKASFDAGSSHLGEIGFTWQDTELDFVGVDLSDDGTDLLNDAYTKIKTLSSVEWQGGTLDFTAATEPTP